MFGVFMVQSHVCREWGSYLISAFLVPGQGGIRWLNFGPSHVQGLASESSISKGWVELCRETFWMLFPHAAKTSAVVRWPWAADRDPGKAGPQGNISISGGLNQHRFVGSPAPTDVLDGSQQHRVPSGCSVAVVFLCKTTVVVMMLSFTK